MKCLLLKASTAAEAPTPVLFETDSMAKIMEMVGITKFVAGFGRKLKEGEAETHQALMRVPNRTVLAPVMVCAAAHEDSGREHDSRNTRFVYHRFGIINSYARIQGDVVLISVLDSEDALNYYKEAYLEQFGVNAAAAAQADLQGKQS